MSRFEGRNLPDLLELLEPIVYAEPVSLLPQTAGWGVLALWLLGMAAVLTLHRRRRWRANAYRRVACAEIDALLHDAADTPAAAPAIAGIVKRTALAAYPRAEVASLTGKQWQAFLERSCNQDREVVSASAQLVQAAYQPDIEAAQIAPAARRWIERHRV